MNAIYVVIAMIEIVVTAFLMIFFAELFDKTQLVVISLASKYSRGKVFAASTFALIFVALISSYFGKILATLLPIDYVKIFSGIIFLFFGAIALIKRSENGINNNIRIDSNIFLKCFSLTFFAELGDKTQISVILLSASSQLAFFVFIGAAIAFIAITLIGVFLGDLLKTKLGAYQKEINIGVALIFIAIGILLVLNMF